MGCYPNNSVSSGSSEFGTSVLFLEPLHNHIARIAFESLESKTYVRLTASVH